MLQSLVTKIVTIVIGTGILLAPDAFSQSTDNAAPRVETENGTVEGINDSGVYIYKGIPFAAPPVGKLRWRPPRPVDDWTGIKQIKQFGPRCMQRPIFDDMVFRSDGMSEDCLYLNVWSPVESPGADLPVLVYFYGGGLMAGDGSEPRYDGESMARNKGLVVVTVNYRLSVFGFLSHPGLTAESPHSASGNYGLLDQARALQWVKENIEAFGGDPEQVTIAGESAGSMSVSAQMASPLSRDLIAGAVGESGSLLGSLSAVSLRKGEKAGRTFQDLLGAASLEEMRQMPAEKVLEATAREDVPRFPVTVDGYFFPKKPIEIYRSGEQADVPLLVGWNSEEMSHQFLFQGKKPTPENYKALVNQLYGEHADKILDLYPGNTGEEVLKSATALAGDRFIAFSTWKWSDIHSKTSTSPVYRYYYSRPRPAMASEEDSKPPPATGAVHAAEIEYVMGNLPRNHVYAWTEEDYQVSDIFRGFVANFVQRGDPNGLGLPEWKALQEGNKRRVMQIDVHSRLRAAQHQERYEFLDRLAYPESE
ncbi:carboxylesterase/lipase family protein [Halalkalibaculum sp. DA3122]|uniref:carboxylesterase/lipase family protein n=1 Tax=Halalkalibaculum sp. DA3122 TaxID=3373607 RepID=UPI0037541DB7